MSETPLPLKPVRFIGTSRGVPRRVRGNVCRGDLHAACISEEVAENIKGGPCSGETALQADSRIKAMKKKAALRKSRRKVDPRFADTRVVPGSGNVFVDLGFDEAEARVMALRVELMVRLEKHLEKKGYTQVEAARRMGVTQPRVSALLKGRWQDFSLDMLLTLAARAGLKAELRLATDAIDNPRYPLHLIHNPPRARVKQLIRQMRPVRSHEVDGSIARKAINGPCRRQNR